MPDWFEIIGVPDFIRTQSRMSLQPHKDSGLIIEGFFHFNAKTDELEEIQDTYNLRIYIPINFPKTNPKVWELKDRINHEISDGHMFKDKSLCLGSPLSIAQYLSKNPNVQSFSEKFLVPYLYSISYKEKFGGKLIFGELDHDFSGIVDDFLNLNNSSKLEKAILSINLKKRVANKKMCPCGCQNRLGVCDLHHKINFLRKLQYQFMKTKTNSKTTLSK